MRVWKRRLASRQDLFDAQTTGYRLIHGESDGWPGLVLDRYDTTLVLKLYTAAWLPRLEEIFALIKEKIAVRTHRPALEPEHPKAARKNFQQHDGQILLGRRQAGPVFFLKTESASRPTLLRGQKTGFFLDQRENRAESKRFAQVDVLNAFSFSGGFSLYAARGGAKSVTDLDISAHALESAKRNFALNQDFPGVAAAARNCAGGRFDWLEKSRRQFDLIVLDPPSLAKRATEREGAVRAYEKLNSLGIAVFRRTGFWWPVRVRHTFRRRNFLTPSAGPQ